MTESNLHGSKPQNGRADAGSAARSGAQIADAVRQGATAGRQGGQVINEAVRRSVEATAEMTRQGTQVGVDATRRARETANETVRRSTQVVAEGQRQIAQEAAQTFQQVSHRVAQVAHGASEDVRQLATLPHAAEGGLRDMQQGVQPPSSGPSKMLVQHCSWRRR